MSAKDLVKRMSFSLAPIAIIFTSQLAIASSDSGTLTPGSHTVSCIPITHTFTLVGFAPIIGSYSPTGLTGGKTVGAIDDETNLGCGVTQSALSIRGFGSDPGSSWLTSITCNGVQNLASAAATYGYDSASGTAGWTWSKQFGLSNGAQVSCTIVHS